jgi:hypothetical protein
MKEYIHLELDDNHLSDIHNIKKLTFSNFYHLNSYNIIIDYNISYQYNKHESIRLLNRNEIHYPPRF